MSGHINLINKRQKGIELFIDYFILLLFRQEKSRWEILQQEQKLMEEKNKRKKAFLAKAIAERYSVL